MLRNAWEFLGRYANHLMALGAMTTAVVAIFAFLMPPLSRWAVGPTLLVTVQRNQSTMPPEFLTGVQDLAYELPLVVTRLDGTSERLEEAGNSKLRNTSDGSLLGILKIYNQESSTAIKKFTESDVPKKIRFLSADDFGMLTITLQNPSSTEMKRIRVSVADIFSLWGISVGGTFLAEDEAKAIEAKPIESKEPTGFKKVAFPEVPSLPAGELSR